MSPVVVERAVAFVAKIREVDIDGAGRRELDQGGAADGQPRQRKAARYERHVETGGAEAAGQGGGAPEMADAEQMLHPEQDVRSPHDSRSMLIRSIRGCPPASSQKRWADAQSSLTGGLRSE